MRKAALVPLLKALVALFAFCHSAPCQEVREFGGLSSFGISSTYSPDSSHILIGESRERRIWTLGAEYSRLIHDYPRLRLDYEGSIMPFFQESDPTVIGTSFVSEGRTIVTSQAPVRILYIARGPVGSILTANGAIAPLYAIFSRENTYAAAITPLGFRLSALPKWRLQPSFALDLGFVVSARDIPLDQCDKFNYTFALGPGIQLFANRRTSYRLEYLYRHISNAGQGGQNPGIDQGVVRLTISLHR